MANTLKFGNGEWYGKKDTILAYNDENSNYKPLPFDFSRASKATVINKDGLIEEVGSGQPRVDYKDNTKAAMLLEPQRTNLFTYSEDFSQSDWTKQAVEISLNTIIGLDGTLSASVLARSTGILQSLRMNMSLGIGNIYTISCWAKADVDRYISLGLTYSAGNYAGTQFDLQDGTILRTASSGTGYNAYSPSIKEFDNGWYRVSVTLQTGVADSYPCFVSSNQIWGSGAFNKTEVGGGINGIYIYGAQLEQGSYPTSYIPTSGSAVTRLNDSCSQTPPDGVIGQTEGTIFYDGYYGDEPSEVYLFLQENLGNGVSDSIYIQKFGSNGIAMQVYDSNNLQTQISGGSYVSGQRIKIAVTYKQNDFAFYINGVQIGVSSGGLVPNLNGIQIGTYPALSNTHDYIASKGINNVQLYDTRLSNSELATLTS